MASGIPDASRASVAAVIEVLRAGEMLEPSFGGRYRGVAQAPVQTPQVKEEAEGARVRRAAS